MCTAPGGWLILSQLFFFILLILFTLAESSNYYTKVMVGMQAGSRGLTTNAGVVWLFSPKKKIATFYGLPGIQTNLFLFVVHKDLIQLPVQVHYKFLTVRVCVVIIFFNFLYMNFNYCWNLTRWLVFERCSLMHLGWAVLIVFDRVIAL